MTDFTNIDEALQAIDDEAATDAWEWLQNNKSETVKAIRYLVGVAGMKPDQIIEKLGRTYGDSEPNARHKMTLVVKALARGGL